MAISLTQQEKLILKTVSIPPRPQALLQFSEEAKLPEPNITKISEILQSDVAISAAILQVVNSAAFRRSREIDSIEQAVMILGLKRLIPLVKAVALKSSVDLPAALSDFWETQSEIGLHASLICNSLIAQHWPIMPICLDCFMALAFRYYASTLMTIRVY